MLLSDLLDGKRRKHYIVWSVQQQARPALIVSGDWTPSPDQQMTLELEDQGSIATQLQMYPWCTNQARLQK